MAQAVWGKKTGSRNVHSDKAAAEALAIAERMRRVLAEMEAFHANRGAAALNERQIPTADGQQVVRKPGLQGAATPPRT
jgi:hypothetical protein